MARLFGLKGNAAQGLAGGLGALEGMFPQSSTTTTDSNSNSSGQSITNPILGQSSQNFLDQLINSYRTMIQQSQQFNMRPYYMQQANNINATSDANQQAIDSNLAARGLSTSPVAAALTARNTMNRTNQLNTVLQQLPLYQQQLQQGVLGQAGNFFSMIPRGSQTDQNATQQSHQVAKTTSGGGIGGAIGGALGMASLFSDETLKEDIKDIKGKDAIKLLAKLEPVKWNWKENKEPSHGFIAQKVQKVLPRSVVKDSEGFHRLDVFQVLPNLVAAVNELSKSQRVGKR